MSVQNIVLRGFGPTGTTSLIVTSGFGGTSAANVRDIGGGSKRKRRPVLPPELRSPIFTEPVEVKSEVAVEEPQETIVPVPRNPVIAQAMRRAMVDDNWTPPKAPAEKIIKAMSAPLPVFNETLEIKKETFSTEDDDEEVIFLMYH